jgi:hypothetical protein
MKSHDTIDQILHKGNIENELELETALIADRTLRLLSKDSSHFKTKRKKLREIIEAYENSHWSDVGQIYEHTIKESEVATFVAETKHQFIKKRKAAIKQKLQENLLTQQKLGLILGHKSKTHMSQLMNGIRPFTLKDLIIIHRLLKIAITELVPIFLSMDDQNRVKSVLKELNNPSIKLTKEDFNYHLVHYTPLFSR